MFQNGLATCDGLRGKEKTLEAANAEVCIITSRYCHRPDQFTQCYDVTESIIWGEHSLDADTVLLAHLHPTYKVLFSLLHLMNHC
jgi:hypothetical protein